MPRRFAVGEAERLRRFAGLSVTEFAHRIGFSRSYVSQVEAGTLNPSERFRKAAARILRVPAALLFPEEH